MTYVEKRESMVVCGACFT